jgi:hypothetical protein
MLDQHGGRGAASDLDLGGSQHPAHIVSVEAGAAGKPIVLVASAYEPTIWDVSAVAPSRLRAVVPYGFYPPAVIGNARTTVVRFGALGNDHDWLGSAGCEPINMAFSGTGQASQYSQQVESVFGVGPSRYYGGFDTSGYNLDDGNLPTVRPASTQNFEPVLPVGVESKAIDRPQQANYAFAWGGNISANLRWADGRLMLPNRAAQPAINRPVPTASLSLMRPRAAMPKDHRNDGMDLILGLLSAGAIGSLGLAWYQQRRIRFGSDRIGRLDLAEDADVPTTAPIPLEALKKLCIEDASRRAIGRFEDAAAVLQKAALDPDLRDQVSTVIARDAALLASTTYRAMSSTDSPSTIERSSRDAIDRLTAHLYRLQDEQRQRNEDALGTTQSFLRARYPSPDDPFDLP